MTVAADLVNAIAASINADESLPKHGTVKFRRPRAIQPEDCPLLVVWFIAKEPNYEAGTTDRLDKTLRVGISWHEETVEEADTLINDPAKSMALMDALEAIESRSALMSRLGVGVDAVYEVLPGSSAYVPPEFADGLVEGVVHEMIARVSEVSPNG